jgi:hypothetical protein
MRPKLTPRIAGWALVGLVVVDLWSIERLYWEFSEPAQVLYGSDTAIEFVKKLSQPMRVLTIPIYDMPMAPGDPNLTGDGLMAHGVRITCGYHGNAIGRYMPNCDRNALANPTMWALTNTEFILSNTDTIGGPGIRRIVGPVKDAAGSMVSLFQLPGDHSFAWVAPVILKYPDSAVDEAFKTPSFPAHSAAFFDSTSNVDGAKVTTLPPPLATTVHVDLFEPGHIVMTLSAPAPKGSALVASENFYPGWHALVDGKPGTAERADLSFIGVPLPEGARKVELTFTSKPYEQGKMITLVAIGLSLLAGLAGVFVPRSEDQAA